MQDTLMTIRQTVQETYKAFLELHYPQKVKALIKDGVYNEHFAQIWAVLDDHMGKEINTTDDTAGVIVRCLDILIGGAGPSQIDYINMLLCSRFPRLYTEWVEEGRLTQRILDIRQSAEQAFEVTGFNDPAGPFFVLDGALIKIICEKADE